MAELPQSLVDAAKDGFFDSTKSDGGQFEDAVCAMLRVIQKHMSNSEDWACDYADYTINRWLEEMECE